MDIKRHRSEPLDGVDGVRANNPNCVITERRTYIIFGSLNQNRAWISAHGTTVTGWFGRTFDLPAAVGLQFYCRHGWTLTAPIRRIPNMLPDPAGNPGLLIPAGTAGVHDYTLEKYQGRWGLLESYDSIARRSIETGETIVTIRNRFFNDDLKLSTMVGWLRGEMPNLNMVHGFHCRAATPPLGNYPPDA